MNTGPIVTFEELAALQAGLDDLDYALHGESKTPETRLKQAYEAKAKLRTVIRALTAKG